VELDRESTPRGQGGTVKPQRDMDLRARAERILGASDPAGDAQILSPDALALLHELEVHQIELELQNEELRRTQIDLQISAERYSDLFEFAPVGYFSLDENGRVIQANLAAAAMLGLDRREIAGAPLARFLAAPDGTKLRALFRRLVAPQLTESLELRLAPADREPVWVRVEVVTRRNPADASLMIQVAISDIDDQKRAQLLLERMNVELEERVDQRTEQLLRANSELQEEIARRITAEAALRLREEDLEHRVSERTRELNTLLLASRDLSSSLDMDRVLDVILSELHRLLSYTSCAVFLLEGEMLTLVAYRGPLRPSDVLQSQATLNQSPLLERVIEAGTPLIIEDMAGNDPLAVEWRQRAGTLQRELLGRAQSWMGLPLTSQGRVVGALRVDHLRAGHFSLDRAGLALTLANQAGVALENARLYSHAQSVAAVEERQRLARELHDSVAQTFYSISLSTLAATSRLKKDPEKAERHLKHVVDLAGAGLTEMKALIFDLHANNIRREGLVASLRRQLSAITARSDVEIDAQFDLEPEVPLQIKEAVYGIVREALQNVVRHAGAHYLWVVLRQEGGWLRVQLRDDGVGFDSATVGPGAFGLSSMRERAAAVGGSVAVDSAPGRGTVVRVEVPLPGPVGDER
jgi:PAS domain S-box-containing protein